MRKDFYFIAGPTAIGKSSLAMRLAKKINGIILNADSMQVYSNLEILTARPSKKDHELVEHHLYGYIDGSERYNVAKWCNDISKIIYEKKKQKIPIVIVGGTGMYVNSLLNGIIDLPPIPEIYKRKSEDLLLKIGINNFVKLIMNFDPIALEKISLNDKSRIKRIWEVYMSTGISYSEFINQENKNYINDLLYSIFLFIPSREKIYENVNIRFDKMIKNGCIDEVQNLVKLELDMSLPIMRAHGVPEISNYLNKKTSLEESTDKSKQVTRNYVKRQLTWWRSSRLPIQQVFNQFPNEIDENLIII